MTSLPRQSAEFPLIPTLSYGHTLAVMFKLFRPFYLNVDLGESEAIFILFASCASSSS